MVSQVSSGSVEMAAWLKPAELCARQVLLEHLEVFAREGGVVVIVADERRGLQAMDERVGALEMPVGIGLVPHAVEPDPADLAVLGEELGELRVHVVEVALEVAALAGGRRSGRCARAASSRCCASRAASDRRRA